MLIMALRARQRGVVGAAAVKHARPHHARDGVTATVMRAIGASSRQIRALVVTNRQRTRRWRSRGSGLGVDALAAAISRTPTSQRPSRCIPW